MIDSNKILQTDLLDLLFDGRNKQYGAYELRTKYNKRMMVAVIIMIACCLLLFFFFALASGRDHSSRLIFAPDISLVRVEPDIKKPEVLPPPPRKIQPPIKTLKFFTPILTDEVIKPKDELPDQKDLEITKIGNQNVAGVDSPDVIAPPIQDSRGVIDLPKKQDADEDEIRLVVQIESEYPGGTEAWRRFLGKTIRYPEEAIEKEIQGTVLVQFIVDKAGMVSDAEAISGPNELRDEAVRVIKKSGQWKPAIQNGRQVKSYKRQPIIFVLQ